MSKSTVKYILMFLGVLIFLACYLLIYMDYTTKTDNVNSEIKGLNERLTTLKGYDADMTRLTEGISQDKTEISIYLDKYYSSERPEDFIILSTDLEDNVGLGVTGLTFAEPAAIYAIAGVGDGKDDRTPVVPLELLCFRISSTITASMDYEQMKQALDYIAELKDVTKLNSLDITFDSSSGLITGALSLDKYYITGRDIPEHQTDIPFTELGKDILMGG